MHVAGKSDILLVPAKQANKAGPQTTAESVEERRLTKENASQSLLVRTQSPDFPSHGLFGVQATTQRDRGDLIPMRRDSSISKVGSARRKWVEAPRTEPVPVFATCRGVVVLAASRGFHRRGFDGERFGNRYPATLEEVG
jgi:hypothetical protein